MTKAKKSLGQNFLRDPKILKKIVDFAKVEKEDLVLEVGPGEGTLTKLLLEKAKKVVAVEKDREMVALLEDKFVEEIKGGKLEVVEGDILELEAESLELEEKNKKFENSKLSALSYKLIGNIPYYITGALFKKFLEEASQPPKSITFVVQKEVAERIVAKGGKESILSISVKAYGDPELGGTIKAGSFYPKPKVDSAIIAIRNISKERFSSLSTDISLLGNSSARKARSENLSLLENKFFEILKAGFAHKRKFLIRNLVSSTPSNNPAMKEIFAKCGISEKARAEDLKVDDWMRLTKELSSSFPL